METWIGATLLGALFQTWRTALQQRLRGTLSVSAAGFVRYVYALPAGLLFLLGWTVVRGQALPFPAGGAAAGDTLRVLALCAGGGLCQILATNLLIMAFGYRSFAVGTAYAKTEAAQGAVLALVLLNEAISSLAWVGILIGVCGVLLLSLAGRVGSAAEVARATVQPAALCGLGAGFLFAATAVLVRSANLALAAPDPIQGALVVLVVTNGLQTAMQGSWLRWREPQQFRLCFATWRSSGLVGTLSACGSACWFTAFALAPVALVRALGQVEMVFTLLFSRFYLRETLRPADVAGLSLVVGGVMLVLLGR